MFEIKTKTTKNSVDIYNNDKKQPISLKIKK